MLNNDVKKMLKSRRLPMMKDEQLIAWHCTV